MQRKTFVWVLILLLTSCIVALAAEGDTVQTAEGPLKITPIKHASVMLEFKNKVIHIDPWSQGDYTGLPKADLILITDIHGDHMDSAKIKEIKKDGTVIVAPAAVAKTVTEATVISNGESKTIEGIQIEAVPMYNLVRGPARESSFMTRDGAMAKFSRLGENESTFPETLSVSRR